MLLVRLAVAESMHWHHTHQKVFDFALCDLAISDFYFAFELSGDDLNDLL